jgi:hypothetical protein
LIDTLRPKDHPKKVIYVYDSQGNLLQPPEEIPEPDSISGGLSALSGYVARLFAGSNRTASLGVFLTDEYRGFGLTRNDDHILLFFSCLAQDATPLESEVRAFFASRDIAPANDYLCTDDTTRCLEYPLPKLVDDVTALCRKLLIECFGVQADDTLLFALH